MRIGSDEAADGGRRIFDRKYAYSALAEKFNATIFQLEMRFFGESKPTKFVSRKQKRAPPTNSENILRAAFSDTSVAHLEYLTALQIVNDVSRFIEFIDTKSGARRHRWLLIGDGYGGSIAVRWPARLQTLVCAAAALSALSSSIAARAECRRLVELQLLASAI